MAGSPMGGWRQLGLRPAVRSRIGRNRPRKGIYMRIKIMVMAAALALAILSLVGIVAASAGVKRFESRIRVISATTDYSDTFGYLTYIDGKVKSRKPACRRKRRVTVNGFYDGKWQHLPGRRTTT